MRNEIFLFEAVGMIDDDIIESASEENGARPVKLTFGQKWGAVAACLLIIAVINVAFVYRFWWEERDPGGNVTPGDSLTDTSTDTSTDTTTDALTIDDYVDRRYVRVTDDEHYHMYVSIYSDGTFRYIPPYIASSGFGPGTWTVDGDVIVLYLEQLGTNYFRMEDGNLVFIEEGSGNFTYAHLKDGEVLERGETEESRFETTLEFSITENVEDVDWSGHDEIYGWMGAREYLGTGYKKIISEDGSETKPPYHVSYLITAYPDYADGGEYVTRIDITDPDVKVYGIGVNSSFDYCTRVLHGLFGFEISYSDTAVPALVAEKDGITIRVKKPTGDGLPSISISVEVTNRDGIVY